MMIREALARALPDEERVFLWPEDRFQAPDSARQLVFTQWGGDGSDRSARGISDPWLTVFRPSKSSGVGILLAPGGAYGQVMVDNEGYEVARELAKLGFTVFVLFYRLPGEGWESRGDVPLADAQRAMRLIRGGAQDYGINPEHVVAMGFSAGGHLAATLANCSFERVYPPVDETDTLSARPWLAVLVYPVVSMVLPHRHALCHDLLLGTSACEQAAIARSIEKTVTADSPPHLIIHAEDDTVVGVEHALLLRDALKAASVPVTCLLAESGNHGFGVRRIAETELACWPQLLAEWVGKHQRAAESVA